MYNPRRKKMINFLRLEGVEYYLPWPVWWVWGERRGGWACWQRPPDPAAASPWSPLWATRGRGSSPPTPQNLATAEYWYHKSSVGDPWHFGMDPNPCLWLMFPNPAAPLNIRYPGKPYNFPPTLLLSTSDRNCRQISAPVGKSSPYTVHTHLAGPFEFCSRIFSQWPPIRKSPIPIPSTPSSSVYC